MEKMILIKYGELTTKKGNRNFFVETNILPSFISSNYSDLIEEN